MSWSGYIPGSLLRDLAERGDEINFVDGTLMTTHGKAKRDGMNDIYSERAALAAFLTKIYPAVIAHNDPTEPDWAVLYLDTPEGQLSWHIAEGDMHMFEDVPRSDDVAWDGHTTEEKYERLARLWPFRLAAAS